ncbi:MAG: PQQ-binding-like beta-propeller repeat protein [Planctomycetia bacterium]|nr:PQQ-binding-like beta-propeller repeat protein [Planctomycetia bacterium]
MNQRFLYFILAVAMFASRHGQAADWPTYRADAARSGYTAEPIPNQLQLRWTYRSQHPPQPAWPTSERMQFDTALQPVMMGDFVLFGSSADGKVYCLDARSGRQRWTFYTDGPVRFAPAGWRDRVFVVSDDGWLYAIRLSDGGLLWKQRGGPSDESVLGNERMISHWPARGGPVVIDDTVYFAAGIWPSDGVYLHAIDAETGAVTWSNGETGGLNMPQPHGGANAKSGVAPQGYLLASDESLFVPTGRAVPAAFRRSDGQLLYYHLQENQQRGGTWAMLADDFLLNSGCLFDQQTGALAGQLGFAPLVATPEGLLWATGRSLARYRWQDAERRDRKGQLVKYRGLEELQLVQRDREVFELIVAGDDAICGEVNRISAVDYTRQRNTWWSHEVDGTVLGLAAAGGRVVASTDRGVIYCFDGEAEAGETRSGAQDPALSRPVDAGGEIDFIQAAEEIIRKTNVVEGFCIDFGAGDGRLALELAKRTKLHIYAVEPDAEKVAAARQRLDEAGLYGVRVTVHQADPARIAYPKYFANLVVSSQARAGDLDKETRDQMLRVQSRIYGGWWRRRLVCFGCL